MKLNKAAFKVNLENAKILYRLFQILQLLLCIMLSCPKQVISINPICKSLVWLIKIEGAKWGKCKTASNAQRSTFVFSPFSFYTLGAGKKQQYQDCQCTVKGCESYWLFALFRKKKGKRKVDCFFLFCLNQSTALGCCQWVRCVSQFILTMIFDKEK